MDKNKISPVIQPLAEANERLYGQNPKLDAITDLNINPFRLPNDTYVPYDVSENPAAMYAYKEGFDTLFPAALLTSGKLGQLAAESAVYISSPEQAEKATEEISDPTQRDYARSSIALHYLYSDRKDRLERAEVTLAQIDDLGFATHVLAQIVKANDERLIAINEAHRQAIEDALRKKAKELAMQHDAHLADILDEAAQALHDQALHAQAVADSEVHMNAELPATRTSGNPSVSPDGTQRVDMSAYL